MGGTMTMDLCSHGKGKVSLDMRNLGHLKVFTAHNSDPALRLATGEHKYCWQHGAPLGYHIHTNWWLPVGLAGWINGSMHISTIFAYNCFRWIETVDAHCGYNFPFSPFSAIPLFGNYGATVIWDKLLGTVAPAFYEYARKIR